MQLLNDSAQDAHRHLGLLLSHNHDTLAADRAVIDYYRNGGEWRWAVADTAVLLHQADTLAAFLRQQARSIGFGDNAFFSDEVQRHIDHFRRLDFDSAGASFAEKMAGIELSLSKGIVRYAMGQRYGFTNPEVILNPKDGRRVYDIANEHPDDNFIAEVFGHQDDVLDYLASLEPTSDYYRGLKERLANDTTTAESRHRIISNMERCRWHHKKQPAKDQRYVFVNIPSQQLWAIRPDSVFSMRICCGAWGTKTPLLVSAINRVELNPEWKIPFNIVRDEVSHHAGDSAYFARHNYYIMKGGSEVSAKSVTPAQMRAGGYRVAQRSGAGNSLGRIIFRFPNQFDVYLHDTNNRSAFNAERRTVSHGCVRVQRPFDLAMFVLPDATERLLDEMRISIDLKPESEWGKNYMKEREELKARRAEAEKVAENNSEEAVELPPSPDKKYPTRLKSTVSVDHVPVIIDYYTLYPNPETGKWETWRDRYEYDKAIIEYIKPFLP
jgi:murein L,D-transpeptidase YcbB/YkuD